MIEPQGKTTVKGVKKIACRIHEKVKGETAEFMACKLLGEKLKELAKVENVILVDVKGASRFYAPQRGENEVDIWVAGIPAVPKDCEWVKYTFDPSVEIYCK